LKASEENHRYKAGVPANSLEVWVDGVRLAVAREGVGPPVICLHAIGHGGRDFEAFVAAVRDQFELIRVDWPSQGRSGEDKSAATPIRYATLLRGIVSELKLEAPIIIGCSIGGAAAIRYASEYPVKALVLANTGGLVEITKGIQRGCLLLARLFSAGIRQAWWYKTFFSCYYRLVLPTAAAIPQRKRIVDSAYETAAVLSDAWRHFAVECEADHRKMAISLKVPVLFAWAMNDKINQFSAVEPVIRQMSNVSVVKFAGGHAAFLEYPTEFVMAFREFIQQRVPASVAA
jgi:4,5:9,10-diseco-3-hydroxy-5,9,17-trioxoandrosta-1(10),2-diene-4-oate hydrolase